VSMSSAWGFFLPLAVIIANRCRASSSWFSFHRFLAGTGWTLQLIGAICAVYYAEVHSDHWDSGHAKLGFFIIAAGFMQPISAFFRPHPPPGGVGQRVPSHSAGPSLRYIIRVSDGRPLYVV